MGPDDRLSGRMPPLTHVPELLSAPPSGAGEGTGANPDDDICNNLNPRQPADELAEDDDLPAHPPFNHYVQEYDRTNGTQSAPPSIEGEGSEESRQGPEVESTENDTNMFRDSGHAIAALNDASAPQLPPNDVNVKDSGQGEKFPVSTNLSIKATPPVRGESGGSNEIKSYADCLRNNSHSFPGAAHEYAATPAGVVNADGEPRSEVAGKEPSDATYDYDECDFYDQGSDDETAESFDNAAEAGVVYDSDDYDDDLDSLYDGCESEMENFEFSDSECGEETSPLNMILQAEGNHTQNNDISGPEVGEHAGRSGPGADTPAVDSRSSQAAPDPPRRQSPKRAGLTGGFIARVMFFMMLFGGVLMETTAHLPAAPNNSLTLGWYCSRPDALQAYDRSSFCDLGRPTLRPGHPTAMFELAQVVWTSKTDAWDCRAVSTTTTHICGLWGYEKAVPSMTERALLKLSPAECYQLSSRGTYKTE